MKENEPREYWVSIYRPGSLYGGGTAWSSPEDAKKSRETNYAVIDTVYVREVLPLASRVRLWFRNLFRR